MTGRRYPNLFLAGVAKAATTTWYEVLGEHPDVFMSPLKEPRFFDTDQSYTHRIDDEDAYLALFDEASDEARWGECSPWYLYSEAAPGRIRDRVEDPRVIVILRNPVDRLYSMHGQRVMTGNENIESFEEALDASDARKRGERLPERRNPLKALYYWDVALYAPHVRRWMDTFDEDELTILRFDDFVEDPHGTYVDLCEFLGIDPTVEPTFRKSNPHQEVRSHEMRRLHRDPPAPIRWLTGWWPKRWRDTLRELVKSLNRRTTEREPLDPSVKQRIVDHCQGDFDELESLLGWDLSDWRTVE